VSAGSRRPDGDQGAIGGEPAELVSEHDTGGAEFHQMQIAGADPCTRHLDDDVFVRADDWFVDLDHVDPTVTGCDGAHGLTVSLLVAGIAGDRSRSLLVAAGRW
jgi:hypothetical protein